jgi:NAD(P)-dependent dehydrogenase (short-subunit alcohol dehydrogenase family)
MNDLKGKVAVVTGASKGIGAAIANGLSAAGAAVVVNYSSSKEGADRVVADIKTKGGRALAIKGGQPDDIARVAVFLASEDSAWLTGERLTASGGYR